MAVNKKKLNKIRDIVQKYHKYLLLTTLGKKELRPYEIEKLKEAGFDVDNAKTLIENIYFFNYMYEHDSDEAPDSVKDFEKQHDPKKKEQHRDSLDYLTENFREMVNEQSNRVANSITGIVRDSQKNEKFNEIQGVLKEDKAVNEMITKLRDYSKDANRNWDRIVNTELSNAIGMGSLDRIAEDNQDKKPEEVYVYRINPNDAATCPECKKFYIDRDGSPKVYKLSTLLGNGSNYGKKRANWKPVVGATHPNCRDSQVIELKPGWKVLPGGGQTFIGNDAWDDYIKKKVES